MCINLSTGWLALGDLVTIGNKRCCVPLRSPVRGSSSREVGLPAGLARLADGDQEVMKGSEVRIVGDSAQK